MLKSSVIVSRISRCWAYTHVFPASFSKALTAPVQHQPLLANCKFLTLGSPHSGPHDKPPIHTHTPTEKGKTKKKKKKRKGKKKARKPTIMSSGGRKLPWLSSSSPTARGAGAQKRRASGDVYGAKGPLSSQSSHAIGSSQNPIPLTTPSPTGSDAGQMPVSASSSSKRRRLIGKTPVDVPPPSVGLHVTGLRPSHLPPLHFDLDDLENDNAAALEIVDLTQSDEGQDMPFMGSSSVRVVGVRYYDGFATPGEQVLLKREPHNPVRSLLIQMISELRICSL